MRDATRNCSQHDEGHGTSEYKHRARGAVGTCGFVLESSKLHSAGTRSYICWGRACSLRNSAIACVVKGEAAFAECLGTHTQA